MKTNIKILFFTISSFLNAEWEMNITAQANNGTGAAHTIKLGTDSLWSDGWKFGEDESDYPDPFSGPYTNIHFFNLDWVGTTDENGNICSDYKFSSDLRSEHPPSDLIQWSINGSTGGGMSTNLPIKLSWDNNEIDQLSDEYEIYLNVGDEQYNMRENSYKVIPQSDLSNNMMPNIYILMGACAAEGTTTHYLDYDGDGLGDTDETAQYCSGYAPNNWVENNLDFDDTIYCESNEFDCDGILCGTAELDDCNVCNGGNINQDCAGNCYGTSIIANLCIDTDFDQLGNPGTNTDICTELPDNNNVFLASNGSVFYNTNDPIYGLQLSIEGAEIINAFGGTAEESNFMISTNSNTLIAFSLTGTPIYPSTGNFINLELSDGSALISSIVVSDASGVPLEFKVFSDYEVGYSSNCSDNYIDCSANYFDCTGECGGQAIIDECGICNGNGPDQGYNCYGFPELFVYNASSEEASYIFNEVILDNETIEPDDWIGAFNGDICVGALSWNNCEENTCNISVLGYDNTDITAGYMLFGQVPQFKIFDASLNEYFSALPSEIENIEWAPNEVFWIDSLSAVSSIDYTIDLNYGANLIGFPGLPSNNSVNSLLANVEDNITGIITEGGACTQISSGLWVGSECSLNIEKGYWIVTTSQLSLNITEATLADPNYIYTLHEGANLISVPIESSIDITDALPDDIEFYITGVVTEGSACTQIVPGTWIGSQCFFMKGKGYWVISLEDIEFSFELRENQGRNQQFQMNELIYPEDYKVNQSMHQAFYFIKNIVNINDNDDNWILAFYKNKVIGAQKWNGYMIEIPVMGDDHNNYSTGYITEGDRPSFKLLNQDTGELTDLISNEQIPKWYNNGIFVLNSFYKQNLKPSKIEIDAYPNPFNPQTTINFSVNNHSKIEISIYNISGQLITTLINEYRYPGSYKLDWDASNFTSGVYFAHLRTKDFIYTKKLILMK
tara:strand:- start:1534 stop:4413 length:2880 start_codon:yes stop_codon:yes gene_type:complete